MTPNRLRSYWFYLHSNLTLYATHHHLVGRVGVEPTTPKERIYSPPRLPIRYLPIFIWSLKLWNWTRLKRLMRPLEIPTSRQQYVATLVVYIGRTVATKTCGARSELRSHTPCGTAFWELHVYQFHHSGILKNANDRIWTHVFLVRSEALYPTELRLHIWLLGQSATHYLTHSICSRGAATRIRIGTLFSSRF